MKKDTIFIILVLCLFRIAHTTVWYVHPSLTLNSIQVALDTSEANDTVFVGPGTYSENMTWPKTQGICLISEQGADFTIIQGSINGPVISISTKTDSNTIIKGFTIRNGNATNGGGIYCNNASPTITGNRIIDNIASYNGAGIFCQQSQAWIVDNTIQSNRACFLGGGIFVAYKSSPTIRRNKFFNNSALHGGGIAIENASSLISGNFIKNNSSGIYLLNAKGAIDSCVISYNRGHGIYNAYSINSARISSVQYCNIVNNVGYGVYNNQATEMQATNNWWGDPRGPCYGNFKINNKVGGSVNYEPWLLGQIINFEEGYRNLSANKATCATIVSGELPLFNNDICRFYDVTGREITSREMKIGVYFIQVDGTTLKRVIKIK